MDLAARGPHRPRTGRFDIEATTRRPMLRLAPGAVPTMHRAELALIRARLAAAHDDPSATHSSPTPHHAREHSTPYHLAQGLLDGAEHLHHHDTDVAEYINEALAVAEHLTAHRSPGAPRLRPTTCPCTPDPLPSQLTQHRVRERRSTGRDPVRSVAA